MSAAPAGLPLSCSGPELPVPALLPASYRTHSRRQEEVKGEDRTEDETTEGGSSLSLQESCCQVCPGCSRCVVVGGAGLQQTTCTAPPATYHRLPAQHQLRLLNVRLPLLGVILGFGEKLNLTSAPWDVKEELRENHTRPGEQCSPTESIHSWGALRAPSRTPRWDFCSLGSLGRSRLARCAHTQAHSRTHTHTQVNRKATARSEHCDSEATVRPPRCSAQQEVLGGNPQPE